MRYLSNELFRPINTEFGIINLYLLCALQNPNLKEIALRPRNSEDHKDNKDHENLAPDQWNAFGETHTRLMRNNNGT